MSRLQNFLRKDHRRRPRTAIASRVYAVGDVHGRHDLLCVLLKKIVCHWKETPQKPKWVKILFLGDIIDRGPDSARCVRLVAKLVGQKAAFLLLGNHEDMMLRSAAGDPAARDAWLHHGGLPTLASYDIVPPLPGEDMFEFASRLSASVPPAHWDMFRAAPVYWQSGDYLFVHAGVKPGVPLKKQHPNDLYSIRSEFTESEEWHGAMIVHGHSIVDEVAICSNRIACDTGAYRTGRLSCVILDGDRQAILST